MHTRAHTHTHIYSHMHVYVCVCNDELILHSLLCSTNMIFIFNQST